MLSDLQVLTLPIGTITYLDLPAEQAQDIAPPLLVLHGWGDRASGWKGLLPGLQRSGRRVIALDLNPTDPNAALASCPLLDYYVTLIAQFIEALELGQIALLGHSLGGLTAALFAATYPEQVERLILADAIRPNQFSTNPLVPVANSLARFAKGSFGLTLIESLFITEPFVAFWSLLTDRKLPDSASVTRVTATLRDYNRQALIEQTRCVFDYRNMAEVCAAIVAPAQLIHGRRDTLVPLSHTRQYHCDIPQATLHIIEDCGHNPQYEQPEAFLALILDFLTSSRQVTAKTRGKHNFPP